MKKKDFATGALAFTLLFNTVGCGSTIEKSSHVSSQSIVEMLQTTYKIDGIYVATKTLMTGEQELVLINGSCYDIFSKYQYDEKQIDESSLIPLIEYLTLDELKENYTFEELRLILQKIREEFHEVSYNINIPFPSEIFTEEKNEGEKMYYANKIKLTLVKNEKDENYEIYLTYPNKFRFKEFGNCEFFTTLDFGNEFFEIFAINDFIPANLTRNAYTEKELRALLSYVRELYHNNATIYEELPKLELNKED